MQKKVMLTPEERSLAMKNLIEINKKYNGRINAMAGPLSDARSWKEITESVRKGKKGIPGRGYLIGCGGIMNKLAVRADGVITPCSQLPHIELGQINKDRFKRYMA